MAQKNMKLVINELRSKGYKVEAYKRKDGGYLIKSINGVKYTGAKGNAAARALTGTELSVRKQKQLKSITPTAKSQAAKTRRITKPRKPPLPEDIKKSIRDIQKLFKKNVSELGDYITIKTKSIRYIMEHEGEAKARETLEKARRYAEGYAYIENVNAVLDRIKALINHSNDKIKPILEEIWNAIDQRKNVFLEDWMNSVLTRLYDYDKNQKTVENATALKNDIFRIIGA